MATAVRREPPAELSMPIGEAMFTQRAIRRLAPDPIPVEHLELILDAASKAPSGGNAQPARFLVLQDRKVIEAFAELYHEAWWAKRKDGPGWTRLEDIPESDKGMRAAARLADEIGSAPVIILVFSVFPGDWAHSVFPPVQNLLLAARALGIGSTLTTLHPTVMGRVHALLEVPEQVEFHCCIPLGYPRGSFGLTSRRPSAETTYFDRWRSPPPWGG